MENDKNTKISIPMAIIVAGFLIMVGIMVNGGVSIDKKPKTLSEQVGVPKEKLTKCIQDFDKNSFEEKINASAMNAMKKEDGIGTPFSVVIGKNGEKSKIAGALSYEDSMEVINSVLSGKPTIKYEGEVENVNTNDHILGSLDSEVVIIEYSDFECPFCAKFHPTIKRIVEESNGKIAWVYRHLPLTQIHQHAMERAIASECVTKIKGNDAFWKYADLLFGIVTPKEDPISEQL